MKYCNKCGFQMNDNDRFCFNCGTPYNQPVMQAPPPVVPLQSFPSGMDAMPPAPPIPPTPPAPPMPGIPDSHDECEEDITGELNPPKVEATEILKKPEDEVYALLSYSADGVETEYKMDDRIICIGREQNNCDIVITWDRFVGRTHALIYQKGDSFYIVDLSSKNGTFVNGVQIFGLSKLDPECMLKIANTEFRFKAV